MSSRPNIEGLDVETIAGRRTRGFYALELDVLSRLGTWCQSEVTTRFGSDYSTSFVGESRPEQPSHAHGEKLDFYS